MKTDMTRRGIRLVLCILCGLVLASPRSSAAESAPSQKAFALPTQLRLLTPANAKSTCFDYAVSETARLLSRVGVVVTPEPSLPENTWQLQLVSGDKGPLPAPSADRIAFDGYSIDVEDGGIALFAGEPKGVLNAAYDLAERLGFLFLYPGEEGEWPPDVKAHPLALPLGTDVATPRFPHRGIFNGFSEERWVAYYAKLRMNAFCNPLDPALAAKLGLRVEIGGHELVQLLPRDDFTKHPDMYRATQPEDFFGKRSNDFNFCVSSPAARHIIQGNYLQKIRPYAEHGVYAWHTWPEDLPAGGWCYCSTCRSLSSADQAMAAMGLLADVIRREHIPMRVPVLAYHDTMFPGPKVSAPKEAFLLYAPRERCYGHALNDPACPKNQEYLRALDEWTAKFSGTDDAHTFEYYLDRVLFRGLYPYTPDVILKDMNVYQAHRIQTHLALQVGTAPTPRLNMLNLSLFAHGAWDASLTSESFATDVAERIMPTRPAPWLAYFEGRADIFQRALRWEHMTESWCDYRWLPETSLPIGFEMVEIYRKSAGKLAALADDLDKSVERDWPDRVKEYAKSEVARTRFEAAELATMAAQQTGANEIGAYFNDLSPDTLRRGVAGMRDAVTGFNEALARAKRAELGDGDYYYMYNEWIQKELKAKIARWEDALNMPAPR